MRVPVALDGADALVVVGDSQRTPDLLWATGFFAPDAFYYVAAPRQAYVVVKDLELDRARQQVRDAQVLPLSGYERRWRERGAQTPGGVLGEVLRDLGVKRLLVPDYLAVAAADDLRHAGFELAVAPAPLFPQRACKTAEEISAIRQAMAAAEVAMEAAVDAIRRAQVRGEVLVLDGEPLTSETVRRRIHHALLDCDCAAEHTIVAGGEQGIDPHQEGHGPLPAHRPILIDIFPRHASGYYGDITRTVLRGTPSAEAQRLYQTVAAAQARALDCVRAGVAGSDVHQTVVDFFRGAGYQTGEQGGRMQGFFHGTGHGVGLQIHEAPTLSQHGGRLEAGQVVTVEPGLYYAGIGGARMEDLVVVQDGPCRNLSSYPKVLVL